MQIKMPREQVDVSDYTDDGPIFVRAMTAGEEAELYKLSQAGNEDQTNLMLAARVAVHDDDSPIFDEQTVKQLPGGMVRRIAETSLRLSGMQDEEEGSGGGEKK
jgi:hypothetical protein